MTDIFSSSDEKADGFKFEDALRQLQEIVTDLEATDFNLDQALDSYEKGMSLAKECLRRLEEAELRVKQLKLHDDNNT